MNLDKVDPVHLQAIIIVLGVFTMVALEIARVILPMVRKNPQTIEPNPFPVTISGPLKTEHHTDFINRTYCEHIHKSLDQRLERIENDISDLRAELKNNQTEYTKLVIEEVGKVHSRVNDIMKAMVEMQSNFRKH